MTDYKPLEDSNALLDALEAEILGAPAEEAGAALAAGRAMAPRAGRAVDQVIADALDDFGRLPGMLPLNGLRHWPQHKGH
jgi:hypothetical protein